MGKGTSKAAAKDASKKSKAVSRNTKKSSGSDSHVNTKREARKAEYERTKLPRLTLAEKKKLDVEKLETKARALKGPARKMMMARAHFEKKRRKSERRRERREAEARGEEVVRQEPRTVENTREEDDTKVEPSDSEVKEAVDADEFANFFAGKIVPKLMITTSRRPSKKMITFLKEFVAVMPNCHYYKRLHYEMKNIVKAATKHGYSDLLVFAERAKQPYGLYIVHLPGGPTSYFRFSGLTLAQNIEGGANLTTHRPELIVKNFDSRLGLRISRQLQALFPYDPEFRGRRIITWHNQRDFIFFRHYRYMFNDDGTRASLQEIGPRFTLKLRYIHEGTFDSKSGRFEYVWRPDMQVSRRKFFTC